MARPSGPQFAIGARVWVATEDLEDADLTGRLGTVYAIAQRFDGAHVYSVRLYPSDIYYDFLEQELVAAMATG
ncbi:MAG: hypothetical protein M3P51_10540 [Chloroflexota bacterium]|nr:hypothetical protein [Chloroflexota bacterium]